MKAKNKGLAWISAARPKTLPLALSGIALGNFMAGYVGVLHWGIFLLTLLTTTALQVLSNFANDYGDSIHGADTAGRIGPVRAVAAGLISSREMKLAVWISGAVSLLSGLSLLAVSFQDNAVLWSLFLPAGILAIIAAILYTNGAKPYGYVGLGDLFVFLFFGPVAVLGSYWLQVASLAETQALLTDWNYNGLLVSFKTPLITPAVSAGLLATGVLNINNMRDIISDQIAGKWSIPVRLGLSKAKIYHFVLVIAALAAPLFELHKRIGLNVMLLCWGAVWVVLFGIHLYKIIKAERAVNFMPLLPQLAIMTLLFCLSLGWVLVMPSS